MIALSKTCRSRSGDADVDELDDEFGSYSAAKNASG